MSNNDLSSLRDEKINEFNDDIKDNAMINNKNNFSNDMNDAEYCFTKNQTNNNLERFKNLAQSVKSSYKKDSDFNKNSANNSKLFEKKKFLNQIEKTINYNNDQVKYQEKKYDAINNLENSNNEYSKNLVILSPNKKSINFEKVNLSYFNNNELVTGLVNK